MKTLSLALAGGMAMLAGPVLAADIELPGQIAWSAYDTGSAAFNQSVAIGAALKNEVGTNLRVLPGKNDIARTAPLRAGRVQFSATGVGGSFMAQEGAFQFGAEDWGPLPVRVLLANNAGSVGIAVAVAADICEDVDKPDCKGFEYSDLAGKRVAYIRGAPALNVNVEAFLAYAGLTWEDVERVEFGGYGASWDGIINGQADAALASTNSGQVYQAASGPRGIHWPSIDPEDAEGIARLREIAPFYATMTATVGANIDGTDGVPTAGYAYPVLVSMADQDADLVYNMTKAMVELFPEYDGKAPGIFGWSKDRQDFQWVVPYHDGAIRYWNEIGLWSDAAQAHNDGLIARQQALQAAWDELKAEDPEEWQPAWEARRRAALAAGGFEVVF